jgi:hypothetical protein
VKETKASDPLLIASRLPSKDGAADDGHDEGGDQGSRIRLERQHGVEASLLRIAFGNQTISRASASPLRHTARREIHGFASLPHGKFAFIACNRCLKELAA